MLHSTVLLVLTPTQQSRGMKMDLSKCKQRHILCTYCSLLWIALSLASIWHCEPEWWDREMRFYPGLACVTLPEILPCTCKSNQPFVKLHLLHLLGGTWEALIQTVWWLSSGLRSLCQASARWLWCLAIQLCLIGTMMYFFWLLRTLSGTLCRWMIRPCLHLVERAQFRALTCVIANLTFNLR